MPDVLGSSGECIHAYGFFPCADSVWGYIYEIVVLQYLMSHGEMLMTRASTHIFTLLGTGIYGAVIFRLLMALPTLVITTVSGIGSTKETAQSQVSVGISVSAGSTIFNLTVLWGINVFLGSTKDSQTLETHDDLSPQLLTVDEHIESSVHLENKDSSSLFSGFSDTGVKIDKHTSDAANFMFLSSIPFALMQLMHLSSNSKIRLTVIGISLLFTFVSLLFYFRYQIQDEPAQINSLAYARFEIQNTFKNALKQFDHDHDGKISESEFLKGVKRLMGRNNAESSESSHQVASKTNDVPKKRKTYSQKELISNVLQVIAGSAVLLVLAKPLTMNTQQLSAMIGLSPLVISFVVIPAVMNTRRAVAALFPPNKDRHEVASITFIELYNGVVMNNMMGMIATLVIVLAKELEWDYSAEVLVIFVVCAIMVLFSWFRASSTYPKWSCFAALLLYICAAIMFCRFAYKSL